MVHMVYKQYKFNQHKLVEVVYVTRIQELPMCERTACEIQLRPPSRLPHAVSNSHVVSIARSQCIAKVVLGPAYSGLYRQVV